MKRLSITIEWGRDEPEPPEASAQGSDSYTENAAAPERRPLGFAPPSDPVSYTHLTLPTNREV